MSAFSFTAPFISPEQEHEEYSSFTEEERNSIINDLYGTEASVESYNDASPETIEKSLCLLHIAMENIEPQDKAAYLEALERVPCLVEQESPGKKFLLASKCDPWAAASRLVTYWKFRKEFFGPDRAFRPMTLEGAMREDRRVFDLGFIALLGHDQAGRAVIYWNRVACTPAVAHRDCFLRIIFYLIHVACEDDNVCSKGIVCIYNARGYDLYRNFNRILMKKISNMPSGWAAALRSVHIVTGSGQSVVSLILPIMKQLMGLHQRHRLKIHAGSDLEVMDRLNDFGITKDNLPATFGGDWKINNFHKWTEQRLQVEATRNQQFLGLK